MAACAQDLEFTLHDVALYHEMLTDSIPCCDVSCNKMCSWMFCYVAAAVWSTYNFILRLDIQRHKGSPWQPLYFRKILKRIATERPAIFRFSDCLTRVSGHIRLAPPTSSVTWWYYSLIRECIRCYATAGKQHVTATFCGSRYALNERECCKCCFLLDTSRVYIASTNFTNKLFEFNKAIFKSKLSV
jgi:hypothetical protein